MKDAARRGFRIIVHSRVDDIVNPELDTPTLCFDPQLQSPHKDLRLYNHTNNSITGVHYDPMYLVKTPSHCSEEEAKRQNTCEDTYVAKHVHARTRVDKHIQTRTVKLYHESSVEHVSQDELTYLQLREQAIEDICNDVIQDTGLLADDADISDERARDVEEDEHTDEDVDGESLMLTRDDAIQASQTRFLFFLTPKTSHEENSKKASTRAQVTWRSVGDPTGHLTQSPNIDTAQMQQALAAAGKIQLQIHKGTTHSIH